jgi:hypothetical protein
VSHEVARLNDDRGEWLWRVAIAPVVEDGPFSALPGVHRELTLLEGDGLVLEIDGGVVECRRGEVVRFSGGAATRAVLNRGPVMDVNVMSRDGVERTMTVERGPCAIDAFDCAVALVDSVVEFDGRVVELAKRDALVGAETTMQLVQGELAVVRPRR